MSNLNVMILGCNGAIGSFLERIFSTSGYTVHGVDKQGSGNYASYSEIDLLNPTSDINTLFNGMGMIIFSLPENVAIKALSWILPVINDDILIVSTCSVQEPFYSSLKLISPKQPFIGINPMFSPTLQENNRPVILILENMHSENQLIESALKNAKMNITKMQPEEHDKIMALCQVLPHAVILIFGLVFKSNSIDIRVLYDVMPPPMRTMLALLSRILLNPKEIYWDIQYENPMAVYIRENISNEISILNSIIQSGDNIKFNDLLDEMNLKLDKWIYSSHTDCQYIFQYLSNDDQ